MSIHSSKDLTTLDFESIKTNLKEYLKSQKIFQDYDFEGSNINVLLDVLSYNTNLNSFYLNMIASEMFLDSAQLRDSIVSHAKELNYLPRSFRSAHATVNIHVNNLDTENVNSLVIPRDTVFTGTTGDRNFSFVTTENIPVKSEDNEFIARDVILSEGNYISDSYVVNYNNPDRYKITNKTVDTNSVSVTVIEDNGETVIPYFKTSSLFGLDSTSTVFFIQPAENDSYEIVFGDNVIGRKPKDRSVIIIQYIKCNGELPNGIRKFVPNDVTVNGMDIKKVETVEPARGGSLPESIDSIKYNSPRAFTTQERAVTANDYETLLKTQFSEVNAVSAYGGEENIPPQFGKVIVAVDLKTSDVLPPSRVAEYKKFLTARSPLSIEPIFVSPDYTYIRVIGDVKYNINETSLKIDDIRSLVESTVESFNNIFLNGFNRTLHYSNLVSEIDLTHPSIISNDTSVDAIKVFSPQIQTKANYIIDFGLMLKDDITKISNVRNLNEKTVITSSPFFFNGSRCTLEDDGNGIVRIMTTSINQQKPGKMKVKDIGTIDYSNGVIQLEKFNPQMLIGNEIAIYANTFERDITSLKRTMLSIRPKDIIVSARQVRQ